MSSNDKPLWYEIVIRRQQAVTHDLAALCEKQQQLIQYLENKLGDQHGYADLASDGNPPNNSSDPKDSNGSRKSKSSDSSSSSGSLRDYGPNSDPINWIGTPTDLIEVRHDGAKCKALLLTFQLTELWKNLLQRDYMCKKYSKEYKREEAKWWRLNGWLGGASSYAQQERIDAKLEELPEYVDRGYADGQLENWQEKSDKRLEMILAKKKESQRHFTRDRQLLFQRMRIIFMKYENFTYYKGTWLQELRKSRSTYAQFHRRDSSGWEDDSGASNEESDFEESKDEKETARANAEVSAA